MSRHGAVAGPEKTNLPDAVIHDERLTRMARGVFFEMLSYPGEWTNFTADSMYEEARAARGGTARHGEGREAYRKAFRELEKFGYLDRHAREPGSIIRKPPPPPGTVIPTALYRWWDEEDIPLYVGISRRLGQRGGDHARKSVWMHFAARAAITRYPSEPEARAAEKIAVETEHPVFNKQYNDTPEARARAQAYLEAHAHLLPPEVW